MALRRAALAALLAAALAACGGGSPPATLAPADWLDVAGMRCADGSPTGIAISRGSADAVLVYLAPGGACWSATACNAPRAFGKAEYDLARQVVAPGTVLDRSLPGNPFARFTLVFVPYCTGDVHLGDAVGFYGASGTWQHHGWRNLQAAVAAAAAALPRPAEVVVAGSSAGGFGALAAYDLVRSAWDPSHGTSAALLDDSGPTFVGTAIPPALLAAWWDAWGLDSTVGVRCPACAPPSRAGGQGDLSALWTVLATDPRYAKDRFALLSTTQDGTMRGFFADPGLGFSPQGPLAFEADLAALAGKLGGLGPRVATYRVGGAASWEHALLVSSSFLYSPQGPPVLDWLSAMVLDPAWASTLAP